MSSSKNLTLVGKGKYILEHLGPNFVVTLWKVKVGKFFQHLYICDVRRHHGRSCFFNICIYFSNIRIVDCHILSFIVTYNSFTRLNWCWHYIDICAFTIVFIYAWWLWNLLFLRCIVGTQCACHFGTNLSTSQHSIMVNGLLIFNKPYYKIFALQFCLLHCSRIILKS